MPTVEQPTASRGKWEKNGQYPEWVDDPDGDLISINYGEFERKNGNTGIKRVTFGKEKAQAIVNAIDEVREFAES